MRMAEVVVETGSGKVRGQEERGVSIFKGIPYAAAPLGENRFRPPRKIEPWAGTRDALAYGNLAIQADNAFNLPADLMARLETVRIPIATGFDSLNVAAASAIALHEIRNR